ncbi:DUF1211 domain-containing protein [Nonomuraea jabiensis]
MSDGVFAIAMPLLVLEWHAPVVGADAGWGLWQVLVLLAPTIWRLSSF